MNCDEAEELITALLDRELPDPEIASVEMHLEACTKCRRVLGEERALKQALWRIGECIRAPESLRAKILSDPRIFPQRSRPARSWRDYLWPTHLGYRGALGSALVIAVVLSAFYFFSHKKEPIAVAALETYDLFARGELSVHRTQNSDEIVRELTQAVGGRFHPMGYDLTAMNLRALAGVVREIHGRKILIAVYQGQGGLLLCYTFLGSENDAPSNAARFFDPDKRMIFYAFSHGAVNAVLHREGDVICILASGITMDELLALARSKAKPS